MTDYNVMVDIGRVDFTAPNIDRLLDPFLEWHVAAGTTPLGTVELILTVTAKDLRQAVSTALVAAVAAGHEPRAVRGLTTAAFDAGLDLGPEPATISVAEAAELLRVSPQAVRQRLASGSLPGERLGRDWRLPRAAITALADGEWKGLSKDDVAAISARKTRDRKPVSGV